MSIQFTPPSFLWIVGLHRLFTHDDFMVYAYLLLLLLLFFIICFFSERTKMIRIGWKILNTRCNLTRTGPVDYVSYCVKRRKGLDYFHHQKLILSHWYCKNMWFTDKGKVFSLLLSRKKGTNMKQPRKKCHSSWEKKSIFKITYNGSHRGAKR